MESCLCGRENDEQPQCWAISRGGPGHEPGRCCFRQQEVTAVLLALSLVRFLQARTLPSWLQALQRLLLPRVLLTPSHGELSFIRRPATPACLCLLSFRLLGLCFWNSGPGSGLHFSRRAHTAASSDASASLQARAGLSSAQRTPLCTSTPRP